MKYSSVFYESWVQSELDDLNATPMKDRIEIDRVLYEIKSCVEYDEGKPGYVKIGVPLTYQEKIKSLLVPYGFKWNSKGTVCRISWGLE